MFGIQYSDRSGRGRGERRCPASHAHPIFLGTVRVVQTSHNLVGPGPGLTSGRLSMWELAWVTVGGGGGE